MSDAEYVRTVLDRIDDYGHAFLEYRHRLNNGQPPYFHPVTMVAQGSSPAAWSKLHWMAKMVAMPPVDAGPSVDDANKVASQEPGWLNWFYNLIWQGKHVAMPAALDDANKATSEKSGWLNWKVVETYDDGTPVDGTDKAANKERRGFPHRALGKLDHQLLELRKVVKPRLDELAVTYLNAECGEYGAKLLVLMVKPSVLWHSRGALDEQYEEIGKRVWPLLNLYQQLTGERWSYADSAKPTNPPTMAERATDAADPQATPRVPAEKAKEATDPHTPPSTQVKEPSDRAFSIYRFWFATRMKQTDMAKDSQLMEILGRAVDQGTISRDMREVRNWLRTGNGLPPMNDSGSSKPKPIDPGKIDLGERKDGHSERQRDRRTDA